ncbi:GNAT family N-acetyltransferase [Marinilactibacillus kalidii]|uniref:GNAT family N-acetyltransferase n=1 Tax=Marinilactibacillus kalidii TaxID=2820274 RepID=UPI001ABE493B|nr:GNAT family N-acetyltransferase [Marinilactibacillus kalidii]
MKLLTIDQLILKQFAIDMDCSIEELQGAEHLFKTIKGTNKSRYWARNAGTIIFYKNNLFCRTEDEVLTKKLKETYKNRAGEWFGDINNLIELNALLKPFDYKMSHYSPFFVPKNWTPLETDSSNLKIFEAAQLSSFKDDERFEESFLYDETDPDKLGIAHIVDDEIVAMIGTNHNGEYTWEIGVEIVEDYHSKGIATNLVKTMTKEIIERNNQTILPVYSTQFTHTKSINLAIRAGYKLGWTELVLEKITH